LFTWVLLLDGNEHWRIKKDVDKAVELFCRAAELGSVRAHSILGYIFNGFGRVRKPNAKAKQFYEKAALKGCGHSRYILGNMDANSGSFDRAIKHWLMAASQGHIEAIDSMKKALAEGKATKDHYRQALQGYKQYLDEVKSNHRDRAVAYSDVFKYL
jgi:TPR repeat protein